MSHEVSSDSGQLADTVRAVPGRLAAKETFSDLFPLVAEPDLDGRGAAAMLDQYLTAHWTEEPERS